jgi:hypothetical protein
VNVELPAASAYLLLFSGGKYGSCWGDFEVIQVPWSETSCWHSDEDVGGAFALHPQLRSATVMMHLLLVALCGPLRLFGQECSLLRQLWQEEVMGSLTIWAVLETSGTDLSSSNKCHWEVQRSLRQKQYVSYQYFPYKKAIKLLSKFFKKLI